MEEELNSHYPEKIKEIEAKSQRINDLLQKYNVDQAAIDEALAAVGTDIDKIEEYLVNNRGL